MDILLANRAKIRLRQAKEEKVRKLAYTLIIFNIGNDVLITSFTIKEGAETIHLLVSAIMN